MTAIRCNYRVKASWPVVNGSINHPLIQIFGTRPSITLTAFRYRPFITKPVITGLSLPAFYYRTIPYRPSITGLSLPDHSLPSIHHRTIRYRHFLLNRVRKKGGTTPGGFTHTTHLIFLTILHLVFFKNSNFLVR